MELVGPTQRFLDLALDPLEEKLPESEGMTEQVSERDFPKEYSLKDPKDILKELVAESKEFQEPRDESLSSAKPSVGRRRDMLLTVLESIVEPVVTARRRLLDSSNRLRWRSHRRGRGRALGMGLRRPEHRARTVHLRLGFLLLLQDSMGRVEGKITGRPRLASPVSLPSIRNCWTSSTASTPGTSTTATTRRGRTGKS